MHLGLADLETCRYEPAMDVKAPRSWSFFAPLHRDLPAALEEPTPSDRELIPSSVDVRQSLFDLHSSDGEVRCPGCLRTFCQEYLDLMDVDHIVPKQNGGLHTWDNVQLLCRTCNASKQAKPNIRFLQMKTIRDWHGTIRALAEEDPNDELDGQWAYSLGITFYLNEVEGDHPHYPAFRLSDLMTLAMEALEGVIWKRRAQVVRVSSAKAFASEHTAQGATIEITRVHNVLGPERADEAGA
ncbi:MAG: HNH endonuclease [Chloroflexi bacterium]|nr:HNH endonuclease [Chloroflexota bacterium]MYC01150.1 HNH endonuclease [Chloroflexota bacterium]